MRFLRTSSLAEYARWYLLRESNKPSGTIVSDRHVETMWTDHAGKMRDWFAAKARWSIVSVEADEFAALVFLENEWTLREGLVVPGPPNYRLLKQVAANAAAGNYLRRESARGHWSYYEQLRGDLLRLEGEDRIAICSAEPSELSTNPAARHYLLDGVGRCLPYMMLLNGHGVAFRSVEAFLAERTCGEVGAVRTVLS